MPGSDPLGPVLITARDIYDALVELRTTVNRLVDRHDAQASEVADHEARIRSLERGRWPLPALSAVLALAAIAITVVPKLG